MYTDFDFKGDKALGFVVIAKGKWPNGKIPYIYDEKEVEKDQTNKLRAETMIKTMNCWSSWVNGKAKRELINFVQSDKAVIGAHLVIKYQEKNNPKNNTLASSIGTLVSADKVATTGMDLKLTDDFWNYPHEVAHIIGLGHEHMRTDDGKVKVLTPKKGVEWLALPQQENARKQCVNYGDYDYESITHYKGGSICATFDLPWIGSSFEAKIKDTRDSTSVQDGTWIEKDPPSAGDYESVLHLYG